MECCLLIEGHFSLIQSDIQSLDFVENLVLRRPLTERRFFSKPFSRRAVRVIDALNGEIRVVSQQINVPFALIPRESFCN